MHIPDGYLSPQTYLPLYVVFVTAAAIAVKQVKKKLNARMVPYLGMAAAFSFLIMMFNVPVPGGTSGHAVGAALVSMVLGPWVAFIAVSVALVIQALVFGDGGITAIGANGVNMALVMPFVSYYVFKLILRAHSNKRVFWAAFVAGYVGLNAAAFFTALEFGLQPLIAMGADETPLYSPYPLKVALPAMMLEHLFLFGIVEGGITGWVYLYLFKNKILDTIMESQINDNE